MTELRLSKPFPRLVVSVLVLIAAVGSATAAGPRAQASTSAKANASVKKQVKKLKTRIDQLQRQVKELSVRAGQQGPRGPQGPAGPLAGPAGGDLRGTYPNPLIGLDAVGSPEIASNAITSTELADTAVSGAKIANGTVTNADLGDESVNGPEIADGGVTVLDIGDFSVGARAMRSDSVGSDALKALSTVTSAGVTVNAGTPQSVSVTCPAGRTVIGGGYAWQDDEPNSIIVSAPSQSQPDRTWDVRGMVNAGSNRLFAWANCLAP